MFVRPNGCNVFLIKNNFSNKYLKLFKNNYGNSDGVI